MDLIHIVYSDGRSDSDCNGIFHNHGWFKIVAFTSIRLNLIIFHRFVQVNKGDKTVK